MTATQTAEAGSLESSDCLVIVTEADEFALDYSGANASLFKARTAAIVERILSSYEGAKCAVTIRDQGALEPTIAARLETALERAGYRRRTA